MEIVPKYVPSYKHTPGTFTRVKKLTYRTRKLPTRSTPLLTGPVPETKLELPIEVERKSRAREMMRMNDDEYVRITSSSSSVPAVILSVSEPQDRVQDTARRTPSLSRANAKGNI